MFNEIRFALRRLLKHPFHLAVGLMAFALGIGVNTAMFSLAQAIVFKPVELPHLRELVLFQSFQRGADRGIHDVSPADFKDFAAQSKSFSRLAYAEAFTATLTRDKEPEQFLSSRVSANWFDTIEAPLMLGRTFRPGETTPGNHRVVMLSEGLWTRRFGADPNILGRKIQLNREDFEVIGVYRDTGRFPSFAQLLTPVTVTPEISAQRTTFDYLVVGRMAPGVSISAAQAEVNAIQSRFAAQYPTSHAGRTVEIVPLYARVTSSNGMADQYVHMLLYATAFALLIACANVANIQLARVSGRSREFAIQAALGASRWAIVRQVWIESVLLSGGGAILGAFASIWCVDATKGLLPAAIWQFLPMWPHMKVDLTAVFYTSLLAVVAGLVSGMAPALTSLRTQAQESLREGGRSASRGASRQWFRTVLVSSQMALALVLLIGAGLMVRSASASLHRFDTKAPAEIATMQLELPGAAYDTKQKRIEFASQLTSALSSVPGASSYALTSQIPLSDNNFTSGISVVGRPEPTIAERPHAFDMIVSAGYFDLMRVPLREGRFLNSSDTAQRESVCVIDELLAARSFPGESAVGHQVQLHYRDNKSPCRVVGVVGAEWVEAWDHGPSPTIYRSVAQAGAYNLAILVRGFGPMRDLLAATRKAVTAVDPDQPVQRAFGYLELIGITLSGLNLVAVFMTAIGCVALVLACFGIYGVMSYVVTERTSEIGMRIALGASPGDIAVLLGRQGFLMCAYGMSVGLVAGYAIARALSGLIFGVSSTDFFSLASVSLLLASVAALAIYLPARRAIRMDPTTALRHD